MTKTKVLDTYALIEIFNANKEFSHLLNEDFEIQNITMAEFWGILSKKYNESTADIWLEKFRFNCVNSDLDMLIQARRFKMKNNKKELSFVDCVGYVYARENNYIFVTGDKEFKGMEGVEYLK